MKKIILSQLLLLLLSGGMFAQIIPAIEWNAQIGGTGSALINKTALDTEGNLYSIGHYAGSIDIKSNNINFTAVGDYDVLVSKYDSNGKLIWAKSFGGSGQDLGYVIAIDHDNNVIICGSSSTTAVFGAFTLTSNGSSDSFLAKLNTSGEVMWAFNVGSDSHDWVSGLAISNDNTIYVSGISKTADFDPSSAVATLECNNQDAFIAKYDTNGNYLMAKNISGSSYELVDKITLDNQGNVIATGYFISTTADFDPSANTFNLTSNGMRDMFLAKYDVDLNFIWAKGFGGTADDEARDVIVDASDNIYFVGVFQNAVDFDPSPATKILTSFGVFDTFISKFDSLGNLIWIEQIGSPLSDGSRGLVINNNDLYLGGTFSGTIQFGNSTTDALTSNGGSDVFLAKYDTNGIKKWSEHFGSISNDLCYGLEFFGSEKLYVNGYFTSTIDFDLSKENSSLTSDGELDGYIAKYNINCFQPQNPVVDASTISVCYNESVSLTAQGEGNLEWYDSLTGNDALANGNTFTTPKLTENKTYYVKAKTCTSSDRIPIVVTVNSVIDNQTKLTENTITANQNDASYQWIDCNNPEKFLEESNSQSFIPTVNGSYAVILTNGNCTVKSDCVTIANLKSEDFNLNAFSVYPNPSTGIFNIKTNQSIEKASITIADLNGRIVHQSKDENLKSKALDLNHLQNGIYILNIHNESLKYSLKLIKK